MDAISKWELCINLRIALDLWAHYIALFRSWIYLFLAQLWCIWNDIFLWKDLDPVDDYFSFVRTPGLTVPRVWASSGFYFTNHQRADNKNIDMYEATYFFLRWNGGEEIFVSGQLLAALGGSVIFAPHFWHFKIGRFVEDDQFFCKTKEWKNSSMEISLEPLN